MLSDIVVFHNHSQGITFFTMSKQLRSSSFFHGVFKRYSHRSRRSEPLFNSSYSHFSTPLINHGQFLVAKKQCMVQLGSEWSLMTGMFLIVTRLNIELKPQCLEIQKVNPVKLWIKDNFTKKKTGGKTGSAKIWIFVNHREW